VFHLRTRLLALIALVAVLPPLPAQTPTIGVFPSLAPNVFGSPSYPGWENNAITALQLGQSSLGSPALPTFYQQIPSGSTIFPWVVTDFNSWKLKANPGTNFGPAFASELGNRLYFNIHITGNGQEFSLSQLSFTATSSDSGNFLGFTVGAGSYNYGSGFVGLNYGPDNIEGTSDDVFITSGPNTQLVDELFARGSGNAPAVLSSDPGATEQEKIDLAVASFPMPFTFTGEFSLSTDGGPVTGSAFVIVGVPEPATIVLTAAAGASLAGCCYLRRRRKHRRPARKPLGFTT
jgi:hypothetical protein